MNVRFAIYETLNKIYKDKAFSNLEVSQTLRESDLSALDSALFTTVVYGVLQNSILLDYYIKVYVPKHKLTVKMRTLLKMSYYQMYFMDRIPNYAIVNEAVEIAKQDMGIGSANFANAVLHSMTRQEIVIDERSFKDHEEYLALLYSIPLWLYKMISKHYGQEAAATWASLSKIPPLAYVRVNTLKTTKAEVLKNPDFKDVPEVADCVIYLGKGSAGATPEFRDGKITIQDRSAQLVAPLLDPKPTDKILDMCAAPGSKATHIAAILNNQGQIVANDLYPQRLKLIQDAITRLGVTNTTCICEDALKLVAKYGANSFDKVLLDAPCSGFGVIRRKPDILLSYVEQANNIDGIIKLQQQLLEAAYTLTKKGGILVYSTCTLDKKENEQQIAAFLTKHPDLKLAQEHLELPTKTNGDGFYMAKLSKE